MPAPRVIVIGTSAGGVGALIELVACLPGPLDAAVGIVLHVGSQKSLLPELLNARADIGARHPEDGEPLEAGAVYVAPPDRHLIFTEDRVRLSHGPRENHARPAIDPLFRSAALAWREKCIGVVLTGVLDDGTAGLAAIKRCGGLAIVQDPATATAPDMPRSALENVEVDHCLDIPGIARVLHSLASRPPPPAKGGGEPPALLARENDIFEGKHSVEATLNQLSTIAAPSAMTCPECGGSLWSSRRRSRCATAATPAMRIPRARSAQRSAMRRSSRCGAACARCASARSCCDGWPQCPNRWARRCRPKPAGARPTACSTRRANSRRWRSGAAMKRAERTRAAAYDRLRTREAG